MDTQTVIDVGIPAVVIFLMGLVGLRLELDDFRRVLERPRLMAAALVAQPLLLPLWRQGRAGSRGWGRSPR